MVGLRAIFPINDAASARFAQYKAMCLLNAGAISREQKALVDDVAADVLMSAFDAEQRARRTALAPYGLFSQAA